MNKYLLLEQTVAGKTYSFVTEFIPAPKTLYFIKEEEVNGKAGLIYKIFEKKKISRCPIFRNAKNCIYGQKKEEKEFYPDIKIGFHEKQIIELIAARKLKNRETLSIKLGISRGPINLARVWLREKFQIDIKGEGNKNKPYFVSEEDVDKARKVLKFYNKKEQQKTLELNKLLGIKG